MLKIKFVLNLQFKKVISAIKKARKHENEKRQIGNKNKNIPDLIKNELKIQYKLNIKKDRPKNQPIKKASLLDFA